MHDNIITALVIGLVVGLVIGMALGRQAGRDSYAHTRDAVPEQVFQLGIDHAHIIEELNYLRRRIDQLQAEDTITLAEYHGVPRHDDECS